MFKKPKSKISIFFIILGVFICLIFLFSIGNFVEYKIVNQGNQHFENLINKDKYQVFVFSCPAFFPVNFYRHPWFVLNKKGEIHIYEIGDIKIGPSYMHKDVRYPFIGIEYTRFIKNKFWKPELLGFIEGDENSTVDKAIEFIENSEKNYPYNYKYSLIGPNSNTYAQWILNKFPEFNIKLSWRFIGKNYKVVEK